MTDHQHVDATGTPLGDLLAQVEDTAWPSDRAYFEARPQRSYRVRPAWEVEIRGALSVHEGRALAASEMLPLPPGDCWWVIVHQIAPGVRMRFPFPCFHDMDPDPPEKVCKRIYRALSDTLPELKKFVRQLQQQMAGVK